MLASAAVLGFGNEIGLYAVAGGLGSVSVGAALLYLYRRARRSAARAVVEATSVPSESEQDALWQRYLQRLRDAGLDRDAPMAPKGQKSGCSSH